MPSGKGMLIFGTLCCCTTILGFRNPGFFIIGWELLLFTVICLIID